MTGEQRQIPVYAPFAGTIRSLSDSPDEVFAQGLMGPGFLLCPQNTNTVETCLSPVSGRVISLMAHAFVVGGTDHGVLVHCGIDTVHLGDEWSQLLAKLGDETEVGTPIMQLAWPQVENAGYRAETPIIGVDAKTFTFAPSCYPGKEVQAQELIGTLSW